GSVTNSTANVNCNGIDINGKKSIGSVYYDFEISDNVITTVQGSGITAYSGAQATLSNNDIEGASQASGIAVYSSTVNIHNNEIGPIGGYNGL
ncbi:MAG: right-handed parallel beta-helix repeat-containing protein, partial [Candidatus Thalassarchaeaceae archaeon]|nr:right-handed parallel beta-helix repeat-containing protein [Candidatus Thalassarchaeaceae archaeon]